MRQKRDKIFENKAGLECFWNNEYIIKRSKFPRKKIPCRNDGIIAFHFRSRSLTISFFFVKGWKNCN